MFSLRGIISDKTRAIFSANDPAWKPPPDAERTSSPPKRVPLSKTTQGVSMTGRRANK